MKPIYAEQLVVAIKNEGHVQWYILEKDFCIMDNQKLEDACRKRGYEPFPDDSFRFGIKILNESTRDAFLKEIQNNQISTEELKSMLMSENDFNEKLAYNYSVMIDFDSRVLKSFYAEPESYENYVPDGWKGVYQDFSEDIPKDMRYWLDKDGRSLIRR